jgi:hypothetical protein
MKTLKKGDKILMVKDKNQFKNGKIYTIKEYCDEIVSCEYKGERTKRYRFVEGKSYEVFPAFWIDKGYAKLISKGVFL